jgi:hypothetical protein
MSWQETVKQIAQDLSVPEQIKVEDMPKINLYMEQLLSFANDSLGFYRRSEDEPLLTKAMINNYSKNHISPPPVDKMYRKLHIMAYALIYQFKQLISLDDMKSITAKFEHTADLEKTYRLFLEEQQEAFGHLPKRAEEIISQAEHLDIDDAKLILPVLIAQLLAGAQSEILFVQKLIDKMGDN